MWLASDQATKAAQVEDNLGRDIPLSRTVTTAERHGNIGVEIWECGYVCVCVGVYMYRVDSFLDGWYGFF